MRQCATKNHAPGQAPPANITVKSVFFIVVYSSKPTLSLQWYEEFAEHCENLTNLASRLGYSGPEGGKVPGPSCPHAIVSITVF